MNSKKYILPLPVCLLYLAGFGQNIPTAVATASTSVNVMYSPGAYNSNAGINYVRTYQPAKAVSDKTIVPTLPVTEVSTVTNFIDGLGRPIQTVVKQGSSNLKDIVSTKAYDIYGREVQQYLPYTAFNENDNDGFLKTNPYSAQKSYYENDAQFYGEKFLYGKTNFETSPLNRPAKTLAPGNSWAGSERGITMGYRMNDATDAVRIWDISNNSLTYLNEDATTNKPTSANSYDPGLLSKIISTDESGKQVIEYKDKDGKVILKKVQITDSPGAGHDGWLCTYYIYDEYGNLRVVIPPLVIPTVPTSTTWVLETSQIQGLCFRYEYDYRNRMIAKKVPGAGWVYMIYDKRDRLVFSQDANMRPKNWWMTNLYDELNRPVATGITIGTRQQLLDLLNDPAFNFVPSTTTTQGSAAISDMALNSLIGGTKLYLASQSINFNPGFETQDGTDMEARIENTSGSPSTLTIAGNPIPSGATFTALTLSYYDDYSFTQKTYDNTENSKLDAGANNFPESLPTSAALTTRGMPTGSKVWVLEDPNDLSKGRWLETVSFYDDKGRAVQVLGDNYKGGLEKNLKRYDFTGKVICNYAVHNNPATSSGPVRIKTNMDYDHAGRLLTITKQLNDVGTNKVIVKNEYDELGQLKNKELGTDPTNISQPLETMAHEYNIRGWLKAINKDFVNKTANDNYFGQTLSYDYGFTTSQFNGNIAGSKWRSKGDGEQRSYGYDYDAANRLLKADFTQNNGGWNNSAGVDFSVKMGDGINANSAYDANGNILSMNQKGLKLNSSSLIDQISYTYRANSNKLLQVSDAVNDNNSKLGDFKYDAASKTSTDYDYDVNGNMNTDNNKKISGIVYNHLNLPSQITVTGKGTITYLYDAAGNKLQKTTVDNTANPAKTTVTTYVNGFVYENDEFQFAGHEEGRIRYKAANENTPASFVWDYFINDHLGNVRAVLTEEEQADHYPTATLEGDGTGSPVEKEKDYFDFDRVFVVDKPVITPAPSPLDYDNDNGTNNPGTFGDRDATSERMYQLNAATNRIGLSKILKVMAGDKLDVLAKSYYRYSGGSVTNSTFNANDLISAFLGITSGNNIATSHGATTTILNTNTTNLVNPLNSFTNNNPSNILNNVKAGICYIIFDEQFNYINSGFDPVSDESIGGLKSHFLQNIDIPENGYVYIYCSNESNINVLFDNLEVVHTRGRLLEETHYYPFGLTMHGISSKSAGGVENKKKYNGIELENDLEIQTYDAFFRELDPQTARWWQIDPVTDGYESISPYASMYNNPITYSDPLGDEGEDCCWEQIKAVGNYIGGAVVGTVVGGIDNVTGSNLRGQISSSFAGTGAAGSGWNMGLNVADAGGMVLGAAETITGATGMLGATVATVGTGGLGSPVTIPVGAGSVALATHGVFTMGNSANNMFNQNGRVDASSNSSSGKGTQNPKVKESVDKGNAAHKDFSKKAESKGWNVTPSLKDPKTGRTVKPDAVTKGGKPVELKPNTASGKAKGAKQLEKYERATGQKGRVVTYDPNKY